MFWQSLSFGIYTAPVVVPSIVMSVSLCLSVCLSVCRLSRETRKPHVRTSSNFLSMLLPQPACGRGSVLLRQRCNMLRTSFPFCGWRHVFLQQALWRRYVTVISITTVSCILTKKFLSVVASRAILSADESFCIAYNSTFGSVRVCACVSVRLSVGALLFEPFDLWP